MTDPDPVDNSVVLNGVTFDPDTSAAIEDSILGPIFDSFTTVIKNLDGTPAPANGTPGSEWVVVSEDSETLASIPTITFQTETWMQPAATPTLYNRSKFWLAKATDGVIYILKKQTTDGNPGSRPPTVVYDLTVAGETLVAAIPATVELGSKAKWLVLAINEDSPSHMVEGTVVETSVLSPSGIPGCIKLQMQLSPGGRTFDLFVKLGVGLVEWSYDPGVGNYTRPGLAGPG